MCRRRDVYSPMRMLMSHVNTVQFSSFMCHVSHSAMFVPLPVACELVDLVQLSDTHERFKMNKGLDLSVVLSPAGADAVARHIVYSLPAAAAALEAMPTFSGHQEVAAQSMKVSTKSLSLWISQCPLRLQGADVPSLHIFSGHRQQGD